MGDIMITVGDILSTMGDTQYCGREWPPGTMGDVQ